MKNYREFLTENIYVGLYKNNILMSVLCFNKIEDITTDYIDNFHDNGFVVKSIKKSDYDGFNDGDELSIDDLKHGKYKVQNK